MKFSFSLLFSFCSVLVASAQKSEIPKSILSQPKTYIVNYGTPTVDGDLSDAAWKNIPFTDDFEDIEGNLKPKPGLKTKVKMLYNDSLLFIAAKLEEPHIWAKLDQHDQIVYQDNDFEVFIDPNGTTHQYFEVEINALNNIFDLFLSKPYRTGARELMSWDVKGLQHQVKINGTLNNPNDKDQEWTLEMAIPFKSISFGSDVQIPEDGKIWRINFSRVQWHTDIVDGKYEKRKGTNDKLLAEQNWVWSPQGVINMHCPERWGYIQFSRTFSPEKKFNLPAEELVKQELYQVYYAEQVYRSKNNTYTDKKDELGFPASVKIGGEMYTLQLEATKNLFKAVYINAKGTGFSINHESLVAAEKQ